MRVRTGARCTFGGARFQAWRPDPRRVADRDPLSVEDQGVRPQGCCRLPDEREPVGPVIVPAGKQPDPSILLPDDHAIAIVLDLVNPIGSDRRLVGSGWDARFDESWGAAEG
jgi:hypothetical protein